MLEIVLIKTNTAVYHDGKLVIDRYQVIYIYLKGDFSNLGNSMSKVG